MTGSMTRLIPAHAGKTASNSCGVTTNPAHPRSRGENTRSLLTSGRHVGSSPLTRGKHTELGECRRGRRLIPAHAGKTRALPTLRSPGMAHPRSRGENVMLVDSEGRRYGSSPLTRGKHRDGDGLACR